MYTFLESRTIAQFPTALPVYLTSLFQIKHYLKKNKANHNIKDMIFEMRKVVKELKFIHIEYTQEGLK